MLSTVYSISYDALISFDVCLFVLSFSSHSRIFHSYGDVTITGERLQILTYQLQTIEWNAASQIIIAFIAIKPSRYIVTLLQACNLLNHQFETSLHTCNPFEFCTRGVVVMFLRHFLLFYFCKCLHLEKAWPFIWTNLNSLYPSFVEIETGVIEEKKKNMWTIYDTHDNTDDRQRTHFNQGRSLEPSA